MATEQTLFFTCPNCDERFCRVEELDRDLHTGEIYHCGECGIQVIFTAVTAEDYVPPPRAKRDCTHCGPSPRNCCTFTTTPDQRKATVLKVKKNEKRSTESGRARVSHA